MDVRIQSPLHFGVVAPSGRDGALTVHPDGRHLVVNAHLLRGLPRPGQLSITGGQPFSTVVLRIEPSSDVVERAALRTLPLPEQSVLFLRLDVNGAYQGGVPILIGGILEVPANAPSGALPPPLNITVEHVAQ